MLCTIVVCAGAEVDNFSGVSSTVRSVGYSGALAEYDAMVGLGTIEAVTAIDEGETWASCYDGMAVISLWLGTFDLFAVSV